MLHSVFNNEPGPARDVVCLNAGAALYAANVCPDLESGVQLAAAVIAEGRARETLEGFVGLTQSLGQ